MAKRKDWIKIGWLTLNPDDVLAVKVAQAGARARDIGYNSGRSSDEVATVEAAKAKRERKLERNRKLRGLRG